MLSDILEKEEPTEEAKKKAENMSKYDDILGPK
jgi:hypothetical protein